MSFLKSEKIIVKIAEKAQIYQAFNKFLLINEASKLSPAKNGKKLKKTS